jgi:predicted outer membrane repeat protein
MNTKRVLQSVVTIALLAAFLFPVSVHAASGVLYARQGGLTSGSCSSWASACSLQYALAKAVAGQEIWVLAGVYKPTTSLTDRNATFHLKNGVGLYGGFAGTETSRDQRNWQSHETVLSGDIDQNDVNIDGNFIAETPEDVKGKNSYHVVTTSGTSNATVLDGFVITAGQACDWDDNNVSGGGVYNQGGSPVLMNIIFSANKAGGGAGMSSESGSPTLVNVTFSANYAAVVGGGMEIRNGQDGSPILTNVTFTKNHAERGGGIYITFSNPAMKNILFSANSADFAGGAIYNDTSNPTLVNVTFFSNAANSVDEGGGAIYNINNKLGAVSNPSLVNAIFWSNSEPKISDGISTSTTISYSDVQGGWPGTGNIDADPLFKDPASGDLHVQAASPVIDSGTNTGCPAQDRDDVSRPQGKSCDMGAYEYDPHLSTGWVGGVSITSNRNIVEVGRPHVGAEVASYNGFSSGSLTSYVPMLFKKAYGSYNSALYVQNVSASNQAKITIKYYDSSGVLQCSRTDTISPLSSKGYWMPAETCNSGSLADGWVGGAVVTSDQPIVAVGRPHVGGEVMTYDGFPAGSLTSYIPMLFKGAYGGSYNSAFYLQNVNTSSAANITIRYYDSDGLLQCTKADTIAPLASKGYWVPATTCDTGSLPDGWVGGVVVSSDQPIVGVGRPHIGTQVTTYNGFTAGNLSSYIPMLFKGAFGGSYNAAFYLQNTSASTQARITIKYYDSDGILKCTRADSISPRASKGYWVPTATCDTGSLNAGWVGGVVVTSDQPVVGVGRPHIDTQVTTYNGFTAGSTSSFLPMLFNKAWDSYNAAFYVQNTETTAATVTLKFYDSGGTLSCTHTDTVAALATQGYWLPTVTCDP